MQQLEAAGHRTPEKDLTSYTYETPVDETPHLKHVGAAIIGTEDIAHVVKNSLNMEGKDRITRSLNPLAILQQRIKKK